MEKYQQIVQQLGIEAYLERHSQELFHDELKRYISKIESDKESKEKVISFGTGVALWGIDNKEYNKLKEKLLLEGFTEGEVIRLVTGSALHCALERICTKEEREEVLKTLFTPKEKEYLLSTA
jgi:hypothetical protein